MQKDVEDRFEAIETRLTRLEGYVGLAPKRRPPVEEAANPQPSPSIAPKAALAPPPLPPVVIRLPAPQPPPVVHKPVEVRAPEVSAITASEPRNDDAVLGYLTPPKQPAQRDEHAPWEQTIGLKWAGWIGALVLVIGAGLGIRYGYEQGWFDFLTPPIRVALMSLGGLGLIAAGEWVFRKVNIISAAALFGAGVGTLFLVAYAGHGYYELYGQMTAFVLMGAVTLVGAGVAMRGRLLSIAVLSLLGGNLAPFVLGGNSPFLGGFLAYLLMLQIVALTMACWGGSGRWWTLRMLSFSTTGLWMLSILQPAPPAGASAMLLIFGLIYTLAFQLELYLSARRAGSGDISVLPWTDAFDSGSVFSTLLTAAGVAGVLMVLQSAAASAQGAAVVGFSVTAALAGFFLRRGNAEIVRLGKAYRVQSVALLIFAVPVALSMAWVTVAWAILAIAFAFTGRQRDSNLSRFAAGVTWILAVCQLFLWASKHAQIAIHVFTANIPMYAVLAAGLMLGGHVIATLMLGRRDDKADQWSTLAPAFSATASAVFIFAALAAFSPAVATVLLVALLWICLGFDSLMPRLRLSLQSLGILALATLKWTMVDALAARFSSDWSAAASLPFFNSLAATGLLIAGSIVILYQIRRRWIEELLPTFTKGALLVSVVATLLMTLVLTLEVDRVIERAALLRNISWSVDHVKQLCFTMLWMLCVCIHATFVQRFLYREKAHGHLNDHAAYLYFAGALALKYIVIDTLLWCMSSTVKISSMSWIHIPTALVVAAGLLYLYRITRRREQTSHRLLMLSIIGAILMWAGTMEIFRFTASWTGPWPASQLRQLALSAGWTTGLTAMLFIARRITAGELQKRHFARGVGLLMLVIGMKFVAIDLIGWRIFDGFQVGAVLANIQACFGAVVLAMVVVSALMVRDLEGASPWKSSRAGGLIALSVLLTLILPSLEIDRAFEMMARGLMPSAFTDARLAKQVVFSIFWSLFAIASIVAGFKWRIAQLRYFALTLFALTLLKVVVIDLSEAETGYRILSFIALGGLLLTTSVVYGKLSPRLLRAALPLKEAA